MLVLRKYNACFSNNLFSGFVLITSNREQLFHLKSKAIVKVLIESKEGYWNVRAYINVEIGHSTLPSNEDKR